MRTKNKFNIRLHGELCLSYTYIRVHEPQAVIQEETFSLSVFANNRHYDDLAVFHLGLEQNAVDDVILVEELLLAIDVTNLHDVGW